jgi:hypothetical protein
MEYGSEIKNNFMEKVKFYMPFDEILRFEFMHLNTEFIMNT